MFTGLIPAWMFNVLSLKKQAAFIVSPLCGCVGQAPITIPDRIRDGRSLVTLWDIVTYFVRPCGKKRFRSGAGFPSFEHDVLTTKFHDILYEVAQSPSDRSIEELSKLTPEGRLNRTFDRRMKRSTYFRDGH